MTESTNKLSLGLRRSGQEISRSMATRFAVDVNAPPRKQTSVRQPFMLGMWVLIIGLGGFLLFSLLVPVASAVVAPGVVSSETSLKKLQHAEGGTVREIRVREGQMVRKGQILFRLDPLQAKVNAEIVGSQVSANEALEARLLAEREGVSNPSFPGSLQTNATGLAAQADQISSFRERRASRDGQIAILQSRIAQAQNQISGLQREREAGVTQLKFIEDELVGLRSLFERGLVTKPRLSAVEREKARLSGSIGRSDSDIARTRDLIEQTKREIAQITQSFSEEVATELTGTRERLAELRQRSMAAQDVLDRVVVRAPYSGVVQGLTVSTVGEVVQPGAVLLEIAPSDDMLVVNGRVRPTDVDGLAPGMAASLRFSALPSRTTPVAEGKITSVSRDRLTDPMTGEAYFLVRVKMAPGALPQKLAERVTAGLPVDVIVPTEDRTMFSYLIRPLLDAFATGFRET